MAQSKTYESWEEFLGAVREGLDLNDKEVTVEYNSHYSSDTQTIEGTVSHFSTSALGKPFAVDDENSGERRRFEGWHVYIDGHSGREIGRVEEVTVR